jgi:hypothetical protein
LFFPRRYAGGTKDRQLAKGRPLSRRSAEEKNPNAKWERGDVIANETGSEIFVTENTRGDQPAFKFELQEDFLTTWSNFHPYENPNHHQTAPLN